MSLLTKCCRWIKTTEKKVTVGKSSTRTDGETTAAALILYDQSLGTSAEVPKNEMELTGSVLFRLN